MTDNIAAIMPIFGEKTPPLGVPTLNPLHVDTMVISQRSSGLGLSVHNADVYGGHMFEPRKVK